MLRRVSFAVAIHDTIWTARAWSATRMPNGGPLQVHLLSVTERIAALGATSAGRMKMMIVAGLQHLSADVTIAVGTFHTKLLLVIFLAVRHPVSVDQKPKKFRLYLTNN